jgi:hypothetical protein
MSPKVTPKKKSAANICTNPKSINMPPASATKAEKYFYPTLEKKDD